MLLLRFPFRWGAPTPAAPVVPPTPPFWTPITVGTDGWLRVTGAPLTPRFEHLYPQEADQKWAKEPSP